MRVRDHVALSTATAAVLYPRMRSAVVAPWAASIFIDVDHYLWFSVRNRRLSPTAAVRFFNEAQPPQHAGTRLLHHPAILTLLLCASARWRSLRLPLLGMAFHVGLDLYHRSCTENVRGEALSRDLRACQVCGAQNDVTAHRWRQSKLFTSYRVDDFVTVCSPCHRLAHRPGNAAIAERDCDWESYLRRTGLVTRSRHQMEH